MTDLDVTAEPAGEGWTCEVRLDDGNGPGTRHEVRVTRDDLEMLAPGADDPVDLVRRSFDFLLAREPKESILRTFDLRVIGRFFPEYEGHIRR